MPKTDIKTLDLNITNEKDAEQIYDVSNALSNKVRIKILQLLQRPPYGYSCSELKSLTGCSSTALDYHLSVLEKADLIKVVYKNSCVGSARFVIRSCYFIHTTVFGQQSAKQEKVLFKQEIPVGCYQEFNGESINFYINGEAFRFERDNLYDSRRFQAGIVYSYNGLATYRFSNPLKDLNDIESLSFSLEICSEAPFYDNDWKSDVTFYINGVEVALHTCPSDYGDRVGRLNPPAYLRSNSQHGDLIVLSVTKEGAFINGRLVNDNVSLSKLKICEKAYIDFKFGNNMTSQFIGGFNVFGHGYGDYAQDIVMEIR